MLIHHCSLPCKQACPHVSCVPLLLLGLLPHDQMTDAISREQLGVFCGSYDGVISLVFEQRWCHLSRNKLPSAVNPHLEFCFHVADSCAWKEWFRRTSN